MLRRGTKVGGVGAEAGVLSPQSQPNQRPRPGGPLEDKEQRAKRRFCSGSAQWVR